MYCDGDSYRLRRGFVEPLTRVRGRNFRGEGGGMVAILTVSRIAFGRQNPRLHAGFAMVGNYLVLSLLATSLILLLKLVDSANLLFEPCISRNPVFSPDNAQQLCHSIHHFGLCLR